jgi:hypothetical protein
VIVGSPSNFSTNGLKDLAVTTPSAIFLIVRR